MDKKIIQTEQTMAEVIRMIAELKDDEMLTIIPAEDDGDSSSLNTEEAAYE